MTTNLYCFIVASLVFLFFAGGNTVDTVISMAPGRHICLLVLHSLIGAAAPYALCAFHRKIIKAINR